MSEDGSGFQVQANFAALFTSLETAQELAGAPGQVNRLLIRLSRRRRPGRGRPGGRRGPGRSASRGGGHRRRARDNPGYAMIYQDIENDQQTFSIFAMLIFVGAVAAAFNLTARLVEAQRREIGIAMALGVPRRRIAIRPLLVAAQIALLGVALGVAVGWVIGVGMRQVLEGFFPLPIWVTSFQGGAYAGAAAVGFAAPFAAAAYPVWRAVRVRPIEAIRPAHLTRRCAHAVVARPRRPANTFRRLPVRNLARAPRRTLLTAVGIASAIAVLTALLGMIDSFYRTVDIGEQQILAGQVDRVIVEFDAPYPAGAPEVAAVLGSPTVARAEASLTVPGRLGTGAGELRRRHRVDRPASLGLAAQPGRRRPGGRGGHRDLPQGGGRPRGGRGRPGGRHPSPANRRGHLRFRPHGRGGDRHPCRALPVPGLHGRLAGRGHGPGRRGEPGECHPGAGLHGGRREAGAVRGRRGVLGPAGHGGGGHLPGPAGAVHRAAAGGADCGVRPRSRHRLQLGEPQPRREGPRLRHDVRLRGLAATGRGPGDDRGSAPRGPGHGHGPGGGLRPGAVVRGQRVPAHCARDRPRCGGSRRRPWRWWWPWGWPRWRWRRCSRCARWAAWTCRAPCA